MRKCVAGLLLTRRIYAGNVLGVLNALKKHHAKASITESSLPSVKPCFGDMRSVYRPARHVCTYAPVDTDMNAYELMRSHDIRGRPLLTPGDGNCSVSFNFNNFDTQYQNSI
ncbi:hypothetical protein PoB_005127000 [Plakobranchus ocellatus]|uniref:Uncharacterized protein n=1 Tax=Plakobranchus ocellatus TaxID=259542 RepID=A0AAV4C066_9GAST|nr:hypothetical protein PoB_005127000 [Plakobranchus ocellatus]